jgi:hypothetical protein
MGSPEETFLIEFPPEAHYVSTARLFAAGVARTYGADENTVEDLKVAVRFSDGIARGQGFATKYNFTIYADGNFTLQIRYRRMRGSGGEPGFVTCHWNTVSICNDRAHTGAEPTRIDKTYMSRWRLENG